MLWMWADEIHNFYDIKKNLHTYRISALHSNPIASAYMSLHFWKHSMLLWMWADEIHNFYDIFNNNLHTWRHGRPKGFPGW